MEVARPDCRSPAMFIWPGFIPQRWMFRVRTTSAAVDRKLATIRETYTALHDEASGRRGESLEVAILVLILMELVLPFLRE